jgi:hypothetical protein
MIETIIGYNKSNHAIVLQDYGLEGNSRFKVLRKTPNMIYVSENFVTWSLAVDHATGLLNKLSEPELASRSKPDTFNGISIS